MKFNLGPVSQLAVLSISFLIVFSTYNAAQNIESTLLGQDGSTSIGVVYCMLVVGSLLCPPLVRKRTKVMLTLGLSTYSLFLAANAITLQYTHGNSGSGKPNSGVHGVILLLSGGVLGVGAALTWIAQGLILTQIAYEDAKRTHLKTISSPHTERGGGGGGGGDDDDVDACANDSIKLNASLGKFSGIFFAIFQLSQIFGNVASYLFLEKRENDGAHSAAILFAGMAVTAIFGALMTILLYDRGPHRNGRERSDSDDNDINQSLIHYSNESDTIDPEAYVSRDTKTSYFVKIRALMPMIPLFMFSGVQQGFQFNLFTSKIIAPSLGSAGISGAMVVFGVSDCVSSLILAKVNSSLSRAASKLVLLTAIWMSSGGYIWFSIEPPQTRTSIAVAAALLGFIDATFNTQISTYIGLALMKNVGNGISDVRPEDRCSNGLEDKDEENKSETFNKNSDLIETNAEKGFALWRALQSLCTGAVFVFGPMFNTKTEMESLAVVAIVISVYSLLPLAFSR